MAIHLLCSVVIWAKDKESNSWALFWHRWRFSNLTFSKDAVCSREMAQGNQSSCVRAIVTHFGMDMKQGCDLDAMNLVNFRVSSSIFWGSMYLVFFRGLELAVHMHFV